MENPMPSQELWFIKEFAPSSNSGEDEKDRVQVGDIIQANVIGSAIKDTERLVHKPVLDIDMPVKVIESSTPGHYHLYIDKVMSWDKYQLLMAVLVEVGIVQEGFYKFAVKRGQSFTRLPWIKKEK